MRFSWLKTLDRPTGQFCLDQMQQLRYALPYQKRRREKQDRVDAILKRPLAQHARQVVAASEPAMNIGIAGKT